MSLDVSFAITLRGFDEVMECMQEALPDLDRRDFEDRWASVMSCLQCVSFWAAAGYGQPWTHVVVHRLPPYAISASGAPKPRIFRSIRRRDRSVWYLRGLSTGDALVSSGSEAGDQNARHDSDAATGCGGYRRSWDVTLEEENLLEKQPLPKSVWLQRGWKEEVIDKFEPKWSDQYGTYVHELPVATLRWEEAHLTVEAKVLEQEKTAAKKKSSKADGDQELDVPDLKAQDGNDEKKASKAQAAQQKKVTSGNGKIAGMAARAMGSLCSVETSLTKLLAKTDGVEGLNEASRQVCQLSLEKAQRWGAAARAAVNGQEANKLLPPDAEQPALTPLPFDQSDLKVLLLESAAGQKSLKESLPKKEPKPKAAAKAASKVPCDGDAGESVEPQPKRRRAKSSA
eukprot:s2323_g20.t1